MYIFNSKSIIVILYIIVLLLNYITALNNSKLISNEIEKKNDNNTND